MLMDKIQINICSFIIDPNLKHFEHNILQLESSHIQSRILLKFPVGYFWRYGRLRVVVVFQLLKLEFSEF